MCQRAFFDLRGAAFRETCVECESHRNRPATVDVAPNVPVWLDDDGLMHQLETSF